MTVGGIKIEVVRKAIKNLHLSVLPPDGKVRVAVPEHVSDDRVRAAVVTKLAWIKQQIEAFESQPRQSEREMVNGETHYFLGRKYRLEIVPIDGRAKIHLKGAKLRLSVAESASTEQRLKLLNEWYREQLKSRVPALLDLWQKRMGVDVAGWSIRKMKTKWGSCNVDAKRILLNLELAKKPPECLEYILVHELAHLLERHHNSRFLGIMDRYLPNWRIHRDVLNSSPLAFEKWDY